METDKPVLGIYVTGWIKRGPTGIIGTNKLDAAETVQTMLADLGNGIVLQPATTDPAAVEKLVRERQPEFVSYEDWSRLNELETEKGKSQGRPRVKFTDVKEMMSALDR